MSSSTERANQPQRFQAVDALRGLAALAVVFYHVQGALNRGEQTWMPGLARRLAEGGHFGVNVFFVLSGFVIARSVRHGSMTLGYFGRFVLRRSIRLDPPYWAAIALEVLLIFAGLALFPSLGTPAPTIPQLLSHLVYLQDILGYGQLIPIFWTLCYEFQFYLALVGILVAGQLVAQWTGQRLANGTLVLLFAALFLASVGAHHSWISGVPRGLALDRWYEFFTGVIAWWVVSGVLPLATLFAAWGVNAAFARHTDSLIEGILVVAVSTLCLLSARYPSFDRRFKLRPLQFLGAISYSLYLYHASVAWRVVSLVQHFAGMSLTPMVGILTWLAAVGVAIAAGYLGWRLIERPSMQLSRRVTLPVRADPQPALTEPAAVPAR
jgi:peptidoglycan/LPS O-acetylase OafA/YrhL